MSACFTFYWIWFCRFPVSPILHFSCWKIWKDIWFTVFDSVKPPWGVLKVGPADGQYRLPISTWLISNFEHLSAKTFHEYWVFCLRLNSWQRGDMWQLNTRFVFFFDTSGWFPLQSGMIYDLTREVSGGMVGFGWRRCSHVITFFIYCPGIKLNNCSGNKFRKHNQQWWLRVWQIKGMCF